MDRMDIFNACEKLSYQLGKILISKQWSISCVESCTGGLLASFITAISGSSSYFNQSWVTYSNSAKTQLVNVSKQSLEDFGAVSQQVAREMSLGCLFKANANIAVSITGVAGPLGGTEEKPVGTVWFGFTCKTSDINVELAPHWDVYDPDFMTLTRMKIFSGSRTEIRLQAAEFALTTLLDEIKKIS